ncbi:MAG: D-hexose-6-phosphate mutarotase [Sulfurimonas sp.]|nr:D-hexose-6-phosphate mutarotase [Sulfurimonas sp.]
MVEFKKFENGFEYVEVSNNAARARIALQGAHIFHFARTNEEPILWLSDTSDFEIGKALRGGIPLCWPSFGMNNPDLPQHGFARVGMWRVENHREIDENSTQITFTLNDTKQSRELWNHSFLLELKVILSETLIMELTTTNLDDKPFKITQAFHTYFQISDISNIAIEGLSDKPYLDALTDKHHVQKGDITFFEEFDCVFQEVGSEILLIDKNSTISIKNEGSSSVVVWNPWIEKCKRMSGMRDDAYREFVCIESANAFEDFKILEPKEYHTLKATIC